MKFSKNNFRKQVFTVTAIFAANMLCAQQMPVYNLYMFNPASYNPALCGTTEKVNVYMMSRSHLVNMPSRPVTNTLTADGPLNEKSMGWGLNLYSDKTGISNKLGAWGTYSYRLQIAKDHGLFFGLALGFLQNNIDFTGVVVKDNNEPLLINEPFRKGTFDGNFGFAYRWNQLEIGAGGNQIMGNSVKYQPDGIPVNYSLESHYFASLKYQFFTDEKKDISITPILFIRKVKNGRMPQEATLLFNWRNKFDLGLSYKSSYGYGFIVGAKIYDALRIVYSYDYITNAIGAFAGTSHEVMLGYSFGVHSREIRQQQQQTDEMMVILNDFKDAQALQNKEQQEQIKKQQQQIDSLSVGQNQNKEKIEEVKAKTEKNEKDLELLQKQLRDAGLLKEASVTEYEGNVAKGYYLVIASVKHDTYNEEAMKKEFLDKGFQQIFNKQRGWHYVYTERTDNFGDALEILEKARKEKYKDAWIHILK